MSPESQAIMKVFAQMRDFTAGVIQQQQTATEAMLNSERGKPVAHAQGVNAKCFKRVESFSGEQAWRDWAFQFEPATETANEAGCHLIETAEMEEKEIDDVLSLTEAEKSNHRDLQHARDLCQGRSPQDAAPERIQWTRGAEKALQEVQPHDADEGNANSRWQPSTPAR